MREEDQLQAGPDDDLEIVSEVQAEAILNIRLRAFGKALQERKFVKSLTHSALKRKALKNYWPQKTNNGR